MKDPFELIVIHVYMVSFSLECEKQGWRILIVCKGSSVTTGERHSEFFNHYDFAFVHCGLLHVHLGSITASWNSLVREIKCAFCCQGKTI